MCEIVSIYMACGCCQSDRNGHSDQKNVSCTFPEIHSQLVAQTFSSTQTATIYLTTCYLAKSTSTWNYSWQISYRPTETQSINKATVNACRLQTVPFCTVNCPDPRKRNWKEVPHLKITRKKLFPLYCISVRWPCQ